MLDRFYPFVLLFLGMPALAHAQAPVEIRGHISGAHGKTPLPGANITVNRSGTGTVSNSLGEFRLVVSHIATDTLRISSLGYRVKYLPLAALEAGVVLHIELEPVSVGLKEVVIAAKDPVKLIRSAIRKIPENYITKPHQVRGFYRNATTRGEDCMQLSEAVFDIYNRGYADKKENDLYLVQVRHIRDEKASHGLDLGLKPSNLFAYDIVKEIAENDVFSEEGLRNHRFTIRGVADYKGMPAYEITFDQREGLKRSLYRGRLFIDTAQLAFLEIAYALSPAGMPYHRYGDGATRALMAVLNIQIETQGDSAKVEYRKIGDRWVLSHVVGNTSLNFRNKKKYDFTTNSHVDYIITSVDTTKATPAPEGKHVGRNKFIEFQDTPQDPEFWRRHTTILADFDAEAVAAMLKARNESNNLKKRAEERSRRLPAGPAVRIDSMLSFYHRNGQFNGTVLIKTARGVILSKSYGYADKERQLAADSNTRYRIGSLSKPFTAIVVLQLAQEGKLSLQDPVSKFLPGYVNGEVTIAQLLSHQSGIPNYTANKEYLSQIMRDTFSLKELVEKFCSDSTEFVPGTQFRYSNSGYVLLALIAETAGGKPFTDLLEERIFIPAGMHDTYAGNRTADRKAAGYLYDRPEPDYHPANTLGAGGITTTAADLLKWNKALACSVLLPESLMAELSKPRAEYTDWDAWYGYGWMTDQRLFKVSKAHEIVYHPGTNLGFYTMFARQPDKDNLVILLNNTGDFPRFDLTDLILTELNGD
ncbi:serine hydrolase [Chitinophaga sp. YIM B06452]|uniref:serine hydrolase n=1 Tax=Chitinophaga sp. YIM B06452 TaxID=3082158 RepID=UPI0031FF347E